MQKGDSNLLDISFYVVVLSLVNGLLCGAG
jgi:hypothetical protein